jgi:hypothetical protein
MEEDIVSRFYLPCSGLPSAFALSKSEKILVGLYMLTTTTFY